MRIMRVTVSAGASFSDHFQCIAAKWNMNPWSATHLLDRQIQTSGQLHVAQFIYSHVNLWPYSYTFHSQPLVMFSSSLRSSSSENNQLLWKSISFKIRLSLCLWDSIFRCWDSKWQNTSIHVSLMMPGNTTDPEKQQYFEEKAIRRCLSCGTF